MEAEEEMKLDDTEGEIGENEKEVSYWDFYEQTTDRKIILNEYPTLIFC